MMNKALFTLLIGALSFNAGNAAIYAWTNSGAYGNPDLVAGSESTFNEWGGSIWRVYDKNSKVNAATWGNGNAGDPMGKKNATYDFGLEGSIIGGKDNEYNLKPNDDPLNWKLTGTLDMEVDLETALTYDGSAIAGGYVVITRVLIGGSNIWYRDNYPNCPDYLNSEFIASNSETLTKELRSAGTAYEGDNHYFSSANTGLTTADYGKYALFADSNLGIGVQYVAKVAAPIPEPSTMVLGLLGAAGFAGFRRRK